MSYTIKIKNSSGSVQNWAGKAFAIDEEYTLQDGESKSFIKDGLFFIAVGAGDAEIGDSSNYYNSTSGWNYLTGRNVEVDEEGRQVGRTAYSKKGWTHLAHPIEFTTAKKDSVFSEDYLGNDRADYVLKFYDASGDEITSGDQADLDSDCVETRLSLAPGYDYEIISGMVDIHAAITDDVRMWVVGGVVDTTTNLPWEYPASSGIYHVKEFAGGINFKYIGVDQRVETDGRASKFMCKDKTGVPFAANQFQFIMKHPAGAQHDFMITLEYFRG